jgi:GxxExxY protein
MTTNNPPQLMNGILSAACQVRKEYGPGLPESAYQFALVTELRKRGIQAERRKAEKQDSVVVENSLLLGLRCVDQLTSAHHQQLSNYLRKWRFKEGLLLNFNSNFIRQGAACPVSV